MDRDEDNHQTLNSREDQEETSKLKSDKESSQVTPFDEGNFHSNTLTLPQVSKPDPSPTPEPHDDTITLGQHHLWMI